MISVRGEKQIMNHTSRIVVHHFRLSVALIMYLKAFLWPNEASSVLHVYSLNR